MDEEPILSRRKSKGGVEEAKEREVTWGVFSCHPQLFLLPASNSLQIAHLSYEGPYLVVISILFSTHSTILGNVILRLPVCTGDLFQR